MSRATGISAKRAWAYLAAAWAVASSGEVRGVSYVKWNAVMVDLGQSRCFGLRACIRRLRLLGIITRDVEKTMLHSLDRGKPRLPWGDYWWSLDEAGAWQRHLFCARRAR